MSWLDAVAFANSVSAHHEPPLKACYRVEGCTGAMGDKLACTSVTIDAPTIYDCEGYRLPTEAEWEYAARAGTRTAYYAGDITVTEDGLPDPTLEPIAWYAVNSGTRTHSVGYRAPNRWMLYDMLGNVYEWVHDVPSFHDPPGPLTDPSRYESGKTGPIQSSRVIRGGRVDSWPPALRAAGRNYLPWDTAGQGIGFRLVRTLR